MRNHFKAIMIIVAILIIFILWYEWDEFATKGFAVKQQTNDWANWKQFLPENVDADDLEVDLNIPKAQKSGILLRRELATGGNLLLKHSIANGVYEYDAENNLITQTNDDKWQRATGEITVCRAQWGTNEIIDEFWAKPKLRYKKSQEVISTYGSYALSAQESPSRQYVSVLSAYGPRFPATPGYIGLGGSEPKTYGQRYVQVLDLSTEKYLEKPVRIETQNINKDFSFCWSQDEDFVVAYPSAYEFFFVLGLKS